MGVKLPFMSIIIICCNIWESKTYYNGTQVEAKISKFSTQLFHQLQTEQEAWLINMQEWLIWK